MEHAVELNPSTCPVLACIAARPQQAEQLDCCVQGTSRGGADLKEIVRRIDLWGLTHLYVVGGNGGNAAANAINDELEAANVVCSVIAVPKSIDNDILLVGCP